MQRINLTRYGFVRDKSFDFTDDSNHFTCYRFADTNSHISKLVADGQAYLSVHITGQLPYEAYSALPHYKRATWDFNGISVASLTDALLQDFFNSCVEYEKEYRAAEASIKYPTELELREKCVGILTKLADEIREINQLMSDYAMSAATKFSKWEWQRLQEHLNYLLQEFEKYDSDRCIPAIIGTARSFTFLQSKVDVEPTYWYVSIKEMFKKHSII